MSDYQTIRFDVNGPIAELVLDRPDDGNTFTAQLLTELSDATHRLANEPGVRAVVLRGNGKNFCFGANVDMFIAAGRENRPRLMRDLVTRFHNAMTRLVRLEVPVLGVAHGMTIGGGVALLAACDLVIATESTKFRLAWTGIGLSPDGGSTSLLPRLIGPRRTLELLHTNRIFTAAEAHAWGFANWIVPEAELDARWREIAAELASGPTLALGACKRLVCDGADEPIESQMEREAIAISRIAGSEDTDEGCHAFRERRRPLFQGR
ncbi:MAG: enoyl-CoA hydratase/isomerase family protein [Candidatus Binatia bacterium]